MSGRPLKILQYNVRKERTGVLIPFLENEEVQDTDILAIQEPWFNPVNRSTYNPSQGQFHLFHQGKEGTRVCFYVNKRLDIDSWEADYSSDDCCSIRIALREGRERVQKEVVWIHNVYNPSPPTLKTSEYPSTIPRIAEVLGRAGEHILLGDFNLHHPTWNNPGRSTYHAAADTLLDQTAQRGMDLILPEGTVTWKARGLESAIDLVFATEGAHNALKSCGSREDLHYGSDHIPIQIELEWIWEEQAPLKRRAWKKLAEEKTAEEVKREAGALRATLGHPSLTSKAAIDGYLEKMMEGLQKIVESCVPWAKPSDKARSFWNPECKRVVEEAKARLKDYHRCRNTDNETALRIAEREKVATIRRVKALHFREAVHEASESPRGVWALASWGKDRSTSPKELPKFPALKDGTQGIATTFDEKVRCLRKVFFPPPPTADTEDIGGTEYAPPKEEDGELTKEEIRRAIWRPTQDKAPGVNGIPNRFLRVIFEDLADEIKYLFQGCFDLGYHPRKFKEANTIILKKPKKPDYSEPKAYRPIALLDTLGKALETVVAMRLRECAEQNGLLPEEQMGARRGRSVETALEVLTDAVHTVWGINKMNVATLLSLDVSGAFDNVNHKRLLHDLRCKGIPTRVVQWTASFLEERATSITLGRRTSAMEPVETGIPQGSPVSPILFLFFNAPLIEECSKAKLPIQVGGFVDDIHLLAYSRSTERNCEVLTKAHEICLRWAETHGASFAPSKYELIHLTRRPKGKDMKATIKISGFEKEPSASVRVLGLYIDGKLRYGEHLQQCKAKMVSQERALQCLAGSIWGATFHSCRTVYQTVIVPAMTFAAAVWHSPKNLPDATEKHTKELTKMQNKSLRKVLGAYRATPVPVLEAEAGILPMRIQLDKAVLRSKAARGTHEVVRKSNERIWKRMQPKRGRRIELPDTPSKEKEQWTKRSLNLPSSVILGSINQRRPKDHDRSPGTQTPQQTQTDWPNLRKKVKEWERYRKEGRWKYYQQNLSKAPYAAQQGDLRRGRIEFHRGLGKAESSAAVQLRTTKIGLNEFLHKQRVPGIASPGCPCGWRKQDAKHVLLFCPNHQEGRQEMVRKAGTNDFTKLLLTKEGIRSAARWFIRSGILSQYLLAKLQTQNRKPKEAAGAATTI